MYGPGSLFLDFKNHVIDVERRDMKDEANKNANYDGGFVAIGTIGSQFLWFPASIAKAYPVQHAINVMAAVRLGPGPAVAIAFMIALLRILLGIGSILAFPGGMIGAFLAG